MNSKKETNGRVKVGQESKWAKSQDGLLWLKSARKTRPKGVSLGLGQVGLGPFRLGVELGQGVNMDRNNYKVLKVLKNICTKTFWASKVELLLHNLSETSKWLTILTHNFVFKYDCIFGLKPFNSIDTQKSIA